MDSSDVETCRDDANAHSNNYKNDEKEDINSTCVLVANSPHLPAENMMKSDRSDDTSVSRTIFLQIEPVNDMQDRKKHRFEDVPAQNNGKSVNRRCSGSGGVYIHYRGQRKCQNFFERVDAMKNHLQTYHAKKQNQATFERYFCKKIGTEKHSLQRHLNAIHTGRLMFKCTYSKCSRSFNRMSNLKRHINGVHTKKKAYVCDKCPMKYYYRNVLKNHLANVHGKSKQPIDMESGHVESENSKVVKSNVINKDDDVDDLDSASDTETDTSQQQSDGMIAANGRSGSPVFYANSHELVKNEPAIDIEFNAIQELNVEQSEEKLWNEVVAATNSEINEPENLNGKLTTVASSATSGCKENTILIKNEPDTENGGILVDANSSATDRKYCEPLADSSIPDIQLIKDETESEVDIDDDNYSISDSLTQNITSIMGMPFNNDDSESEVEIEDVAETSSTTHADKDFPAKKKRTANGKLTKSVDKFTVSCRARGKCKDLFESRDAMVVHMRTYHARLQNQNTFECHLCKKILGEKQSLQRHLNKEHFNRSLFKCSFGVCSKSFTRKDYLEKHICAEHMKQPRFNCTMCSEKFNFKCNLERHMANRHGEGTTYCCYLCKMSLSEKRSLLGHMSSAHLFTSLHLKCPMCSASYAYKRGLIRHMISAHRPITRAKQLKCPMCLASFTDKDCLRRHINSAHLAVIQARAQPPLKCPVCLRRHLKNERSKCGQNVNEHEHVPSKSK